MFDGILQDTRQEDDRNGEHLFVADDGKFVKFPKDGDLDEMVAAYNKANEEEPEVIPDVVYGETITSDKDGNVVT